MVTKTEYFPSLAHRSKGEWTIIGARKGRSSNAATISILLSLDKTLDGNLQKTLDRKSLIEIEGKPSETEKSLDQDSFITKEKVTGEPE